MSFEADACLEVLGCSYREAEENAPCLRGPGALPLRNASLNRAEGKANPYSSRNVPVCFGQDLRKGRNLTKHSQGKAFKDVLEAYRYPESKVGVVAKASRNPKTGIDREFP